MTSRSAIESRWHQYKTAGWSVIGFPDKADVLACRQTIEDELRNILENESVTLESYHEHVDDETHTRTQWALANHVWDTDLSRRLVEGLFEAVVSFIGPGIKYQTKPFLRIARPGRASDNIDYHRDTFYGQSPYEATIHVPFVECDEDKALRMVPGSHVLAEDAFDVGTGAPSDWSRGSPKHQMGFPYAPKELVDLDEDALVPIVLRLGEAVIFSPAIVHGQRVNNGSSTRFSIDLRVVSADAPLDADRLKPARGYADLTRSPVSEAAEQYHAQNRD